MIGIDDEASRDLRLRMRLIADGRTLFEQDVSKGEAIAIDEDITGVYSLTFSSDQLVIGPHGLGVFADARVT